MMKKNQKSKPTKKYMYEIVEYTQDSRTWTVESDKPLHDQDGEAGEAYLATTMVDEVEGEPWKGKLKSGANVHVTFNYKECGDDSQFEYNVEEISETDEQS